MSELESGFRLGEVVDLVRRRILVILPVALLGALVGFLMFSSAPTKYSATARVEVDPNPLEATGNGSPIPPVMETESELVKSDAVADYVRATLKLTVDNRAIRQRTTVATTDKSNIMQITFEAGNATEAQAGANAVAAGYVKSRRDSITAQRNKQLKSLDAQKKDATANINDAQACYEAAPANSPERTRCSVALGVANSQLTAATTKHADVASADIDSSARVSQQASAALAVTSKKALAKGVGVFGLFVIAGLVAAWMLDRRDGMVGGGRRRIETLLPGAHIRMMPGSEGRTASAAEIDTAIDRLAVELVAGASPGRAKSVLILGAGMEPPVALAEEVASSLAFAGIPALFILAGSTDRELRSAQIVTSFADLLTGPSVAGPASLPEVAGQGAATVAAPTITWLRPRGSAESSGLLRRAVVESLVTRAARERFEAVVFVAASPSRTAAGTALGQWVERTALVVAPEDRAQAEPAAAALAGAEVRVAEVVWT
jgi:capsular polysaccharide biosynthesis protein